MIELPCTSLPTADQTEGSLFLRIKLLQLFFLFSYYAREFIERIPEKRLTSQKMDCIHHMVKTKLFEDQGRHSLKLQLQWFRYK